MTSSFCLFFASVFLSYTLQVAVGYAACRLLVRVFPGPRQRFGLWLSFLLAAGTYWVSLLYRGFRAISGLALMPDTTPLSAPATGSGFVLPLAWKHTIQVGAEALGAIYVLVVLILLGALIWRHARLRSFLRNGVPASDALAGLFDSVRRVLGVGRCDLHVLPSLVSPATAGWWRPRILLPSLCEEIGPAPQVEDALTHELLHVARRDYLWASLGDFICRLLFFHPVVWFARERMHLEGELCCDLAIIETQPERCADYADSLTFFARLRMLHEQARLGIDFAGAPSSLGRRVRFILDPPPRRLNRVSRTILGLAIVGALSVVAPALTIFLDFAGPSPDDVRPKAPVGPVASHRSRKPSWRKETLVQSLASVPRQSFTPETPVYRLSGSSRENGPEPVDVLPSSQESSPSIRPPSVQDVVRSTVGALVLGRGGDHDQDHDRHDRR